MAIPDSGLFVLADGMGGATAGAVASRMAVDSLRLYFADSGRYGFDSTPMAHECEQNWEEERLRRSIKFAHGRIAAAGRRNDRLAGMGTTVVCLQYLAPHMLVGHVGDSRCYRWREGQLDCLTVDHTVPSDPTYKLPPGVRKRRALLQLSHVLTRALGGGGGDEPEVDVSRIEAIPGDLFLLCSDGLTGELSDDAIGRCLQQMNSPRETVMSLVSDAVEAGGRDNITALLVRVPLPGEELVGEGHTSGGTIDYEGTL